MKKEDKRLNELIDHFGDSAHIHAIYSALHGIEKETLRTLEDGQLALTPHPGSLGSALEHPYITTDFSESQIEMVTPAFATVPEMLDFLLSLHVFIAERLEDEYMWPFSMPNMLPAYDDIPIAHYGDSERARVKEIYRAGLATRYGKMMQMVSGVHYNFSFGDMFFDHLFQSPLFPERSRHAVDEIYMHVARNFMRYQWLLLVLFGASPTSDDSYKCVCLQKLKETLDSMDLQYAISLRMSRCGYSNVKERNFIASLNSVDEYVASIKKAMNTVHPLFKTKPLEENGRAIQLNHNVLQLENEYYSAIRIKGRKDSGTTNLETIEQEGIRYLETRIFDLNPYNLLSVTEDQMYFMHIFMLYALFNESPPISEEERERSNTNETHITINGRNPELTLETGSGEKQPLMKSAQTMLDQMDHLAYLLDKSTDTQQYSQAIYVQKLKVLAPDALLSKKIYNETYTNQSFITKGTLLMKENTEQLKNISFNQTYYDQIAHA